VRGDGDTEVGLLVDADHARVGRLREDRVAADVAVVLVGDPGLVAQVGARGELHQGRAELRARWRAPERSGPVHPQGGLPVPAAWKVSDARPLTPPMPSPPVRAPYRMTWLPLPVALARWRSSWRSTPIARALTSGLLR